MAVACNTEWMAEAVCRGAPRSDMWFPPRGASLRPAKAVCNACPVRVPCLEYALDNNEKWGIWGGASERERRRIRRQRVNA